MTIQINDASGSYSYEASSNYLPDINNSDICDLKRANSVIKRDIQSLQKTQDSMINTFKYTVGGIGVYFGLRYSYALYKRWSKK